MRFTLQTNQRPLFKDYAIFAFCDAEPAMATSGSLPVAALLLACEPHIVGGYIGVGNTAMTTAVTAVFPLFGLAP